MKQVLILLLSLLVGVGPEAKSADIGLDWTEENADINKNYQLLIIDKFVNKDDLQKLLLSESIYFYKVNALILSRDRKQSHRWFEMMDPDLRNADASWVLIGPTGRAQGGGQGKPTNATLSKLLVQNGPPNLIRDLEAFLKSYPQHVEARLAVLRAYVERASDLNRRLNPKGGNLSPFDDAFIWRPVVRHTEHLLLENVSPVQLLDIFWSLPEEEIENQSPSVQILYQHIQQKLINYIRVDYTNIEIFYFLMRIDRVLGRTGALEALQGVSTILTPLHFVDFPPNLSEHLLAGAKKRGDYQQVLPLLARLWSQRKAGLVGGIPRLDSEDADPNRYLQWRRASQLEQKCLTDAWNESLRPLLVALTKCEGGEAEGLSLLSDLDERWKAVPINTWVRELASSVGRLDLAQRWVAGVTPRRRVPLTRMSLSPSYELFVEGAQVEDAAKLCFWLVVRGYRISLTKDARFWQREILSWTDLSDKWALVGPQGNVMATGERVPSTEQALTILRSAGLRTPMEILKTFTLEYPEQLISKQMLAQELVRSLERFKSLHGTQWVLDLEAGTSQAEVEYVNLLETLLNDPHGFFLAAWALPAWPILEQDTGFLATNLRRLAFDALPTVERMIASAPSNQNLGVLWCGLGSLVGRSLRNFQATMQQPPSSNTERGPNSLYLSKYIDLLHRNQRWAQIPVELELVWGDLIRSSPPASIRGGASSQNGQTIEIGTALLRAYLSMGDMVNAKAVVRDWARLTPGSGTRGLILGLVASMGRLEEVKKWSWLFDGEELSR